MCQGLPYVTLPCAALFPLHCIPLYCESPNFTDLNRFFFIILYSCKIDKMFIKTLEGEESNNSHQKYSQPLRRVGCALCVVLNLTYCVNGCASYFRCSHLLYILWNWFAMGRVGCTPCSVVQNGIRFHLELAKNSRGEPRDHLNCCPLLLKRV